MEFILELLFEIFGEFLLQLAFEALAEAGLQAWRRPGDRPPASPWLAVLGYAIFGAAAGAASLWLFPTFFVKSHVARSINLIVTPLLAGAAMALVGAWRRRRGDDLVRLDRFAYGCVFAFAMAAVRYAFGHPG